MTTPPSPAPTSTQVHWERLTGSLLEELLYGLFDAMGASELTWRSGADAGVTAADGGRDLEAVFYSPAPDGSTDRQTWWIEAKGRSGTVPKSAVTDALNSLSAHPDVDVFVFCTNSRFSNPTRDWVKSWESLHPRPKVRLWDRDHLARMVREHPLVAARVLPEALDDPARLVLLVDRFYDFGEPPTISDLEYFWERPENVTSLDDDLVRAVAALVYAETSDSLIDRPWASLLHDDDPRWVMSYALTAVPGLLVAKLPRSLSSERLIEVAAYLCLTAMINMRSDDAINVVMNPFDGVILDDGNINPPNREFWVEHFVAPIISRVRAELLDVCSLDCVRVSAEPSAFPRQLVGPTYWRRLGLGEASDRRALIIEGLREPCVVGLPLDDETNCPLLGEQPLSPELVADLHRVVQFRKTTPDGAVDWAARVARTERRR